MDPISQGAIGAAVPGGVFAGDKLRPAALLGCVAGLAPDLDVLIGSPNDPLMFLVFHRQFTHALLFIPLGAAVVAGACHWTVRHRLSFKESYLACLLGYAAHGLLDACTSYGTQLFWPLSNLRVAWNNVSVVDPLFTLPLAAFVVAGALRRRPRLAWIGLAWALAYLLFGVVQNQRAEAAGSRLAQSRGHLPMRLTAKPGFANLLVWKVVYEHRGAYYVDAVRTGLDVTACPGAKVPALDVARDLPWLPADSQQARDVERFRWFSDDYIALDPNVANRVIDIRYSVVPNRIAPLWGIDLNPAAALDSHVRFVAERRGTAQQTDDYLALLSGAGCRPIAGATP